MKALKMLVFLSVMILGMKSYGQTRSLMIVPSFSPDTSLVLDKKAALNQANFNLKATENRTRLSYALIREEKLYQLWEATSAQLAAKETLISNKNKEILLLSKQLGLKEEELKKSIKVIRNEGRKKMFLGFGIGIAGGAIATLILLN